MPEHDPNSEVQGRYPLATVESAGEVSPVFERKARELFSEHLDELDAEQWYSTGDVVAAYHDLRDEVGEATMRQGGIEAGQAIPWPDEITSPMDAFGALTEMHQDAFRNSSQEFPAGRYTFEPSGDREARVGISKAYPFTEPHAEGVFVGITKSLGGGSAPSVEAVDPVDEEAAAFVVSW